MMPGDTCGGGEPLGGLCSLRTQATTASVPRAPTGRGALRTMLLRIRRAEHQAREVGLDTHPGAQNRQGDGATVKCPWHRGGTGPKSPWKETTDS